MPTARIVQFEPYWDEEQETWIFDDRERGLDREPLVDGMTTMFDRLTRDLPGAKKGFRLVLSASPFPAYQVHLKRIAAEGGGHCYASEDPHLTTWLNSSLLQYFDSAPGNIYVKAEARPGAAPPR
jgi:hypothetical protein